MTTYDSSLKGIVVSPRNYVEVTSTGYEGTAKLGELIVDLADPVNPKLFIGNVSGNLASVVTGTVGNLSVGNVANLNIPGGSNGQVLTTDGTGNLSWTYKVSVGDVKQSMVTADHGGWFKMDGRAVAGLGLTATQLAAAASLGLTTNLPDATDRVLKQKAGAVGSTGGQNSVTLTATNLPSTGLSTGPAGAHSHSFTTKGNLIGIAASTNSGNDIWRNEGPGVTAAVGDHTHNLTGGTDTPFSIESSYLIVNTFVFLGS